MPEPTIKNIIVTAELNQKEEKGGPQTRYPIGEAPIARENFDCMTQAERENMEERLFNIIRALIEIAREAHMQSASYSGFNTINQDYITRLITNEFFFYTQEPLTLQEFSTLHNKLSHVTHALPDGIHMVLGSFAVKTTDNNVMNVTPHITSGTPSIFKFIVKNHTAPIDVRYKEVDKTSNTEHTLGVFDCSSASAALPSIIIDEAEHSFTFNNLVSSSTPKGTKLNTIVDVCLDHNKGVGMKYLMEVEENIRDEAISHVVTSNVTHLTTLHCLGPVTHVDPQHSPQKYEPSITHHIDSRESFGKTPITIYETAPTTCLSLSQAKDAQAQAQTEIMSYCRQLEEELMEACQKLTEEYGGSDNEATGLQERSSHLITAPIEVDLKIGYIKENLEQVQVLALKKQNHARVNIQQYKGKLAEIKGQDDHDKSDAKDMTFKSPGLGKK